MRIEMKLNIVATDKVYVINQDTDKVSVIDGRTNMLITNVSIGHTLVHKTLANSKKKYYYSLI